MTKNKGFILNVFREGSVGELAEQMKSTGKNRSSTITAQILRYTQDDKKIKSD